MSEFININKKRAAAALAAVALTGAAVAEARSMAHNPGSEAVLEQTQGHEKLLSIKQVTAQADHRLETGASMEYWHGRIVLPQHDGINRVLVNPLIYARSSPKSAKGMNPNVIASKYYAFGYIERGDPAADGYFDKPNTVFVPYQPGDQFVPGDSKPNNHNEARFGLDAKGRVNLEHPVSPANNKPLKEDGEPLLIGGVIELVSN